MDAAAPSPSSSSTAAAAAAAMAGVGSLQVAARSSSVASDAAATASSAAAGGAARPTNLAALFGDDFETQPLWLDKDAFMAAQFDSDAYIASVRRSVPLETVRGELRKHVASLKAELVELINRDYNDFVNLSTKLVDVDGAVLRMRVPLSELRGQLLAVRDTVASAPLALQDGLRRRAEAAASRQTLELLLDTSNVLSKVEKLLLELQALPSSEGDDERSRLLERIASEMNRLNFYVARGKDLPFVVSVSQRISAADAKLELSLQQCLQRGFASSQKRVVYHCLRAYVALDKARSAEEVFRSTVVSGHVEKALSLHAAATAAPTAAAAGGGGGVQRGSAVGQPTGGGTVAAPAAADLVEHLLPDVYKAVVAGVSPDCQFVQDIVSSADSGLHSLQFLARSILSEVQSALHRHHAAAFSPGRPAQFLINYNASLEFLTFLEGYCPTVAALKSFRSHPAYSEFLRLWNLPVYFASRFREIAGTLEDTLSPTTPNSSTPSALARTHSSASPSPSSSPLSLQASVVLWDSLQRCWHSSIVVASISDKFLRLTLQLISRFGGWIATGLAARKAGNAQEHAGGQWGVTASIDDIILLWRDVTLISHSVASSYATDVANQLGPAVPSDVREMVRREVKAAAKELLSSTRGLVEAITDTVAERCIEVLRPVRAISAMYRVPSRPPPTRHSHYVPGILQPLKAMIEGPQKEHLTEEMRFDAVRRVVEKVTHRFSEMSSEVVNTVRRTESSLKLLQQRSMRRPGGGGSEAPGSSVSDTDKTIAQLFFDVQEYGRQIRSFGVELETISAYLTLWSSVAPPNRQAIDI